MHARRLLLVALWLLPVLALAADAPQAAPSLESYQAQVGDKSLAMLAAIFGSANGIFGGPDNESVNAMFLAFNVAVLSVGAAWFSYNIITATIQGSFDGEFLGKRYSTVWMPIRTVSGVSLLVPVWKGWNLAGLGMAFAASVGIGIGNTVLAGLQGEIVPATMAAPIMKSISELAQSVLTNRLCLANRWADQARLKKANVDASAAEYMVNWTSAPIGGSGFAGLTYGAIPASNGQNEATCGDVRIDLPLPPATNDPGVQAVISVSRTAMVSALQGIDADIAQLVAPAKDIDPDDPDAVKALEASIGATLPGLVAARQAAMDSTIDAMVKAQNVSAAVRIKELVQQYGWLSAGATPIIATLNAIDVNRGAPDVAASAPKSNAEPPTFLDPNANLALAEAGGADVEKPVAKPSESSCGLSSIGRGFVKECIENPLTAKIKSAGIGSLVGATSTDPVIYSQQLGLKILDLVGGTIALFFIVIAGLAGAALLTGPALPALGSIVGALVNVFGFLLVILLLPLGIFAVQLVAYVPLMLVIAWIMAVGAWIVVVAESLIAATLWALVHLDPEGEGMGQRTTHGYIFLLNLLFRPSILVFSAFFAQRFCGVLGGFANGVMSGAVAKMMATNSSSLFVFLIMMAAGIWITTIVNIKIVGTAASLMNLVPNQIFTWIGGQYGSDVGTGVAPAASDHAHSSGTQVAGTLGQTMTRRGGSSGRGEAAPKGTDKPGPSGVDKALDRMNTSPTNKPARPAPTQEV